MSQLARSLYDYRCQSYLVTLWMLSNNCSPEKLYCIKFPADSSSLLFPYKCWVLYVRKKCISVTLYGVRRWVKLAVAITVDQYCVKCKCENCTAITCVQSRLGSFTKLNTCWFGLLLLRVATPLPKARQEVTCCTSHHAGTHMSYKVSLCWRVLHTASRVPRLKERSSRSPSNLA